MSSILDALKKLEEEKAARAAKAEPEPFEPERAGEALFGHTPSTRSGVTLSPMAVFIGGGVFTLLIVCFSVVAALSFSRPSTEPRLTSGHATVTSAPGPSTPAVPDPASTVETVPESVEAAPGTPVAASPETIAEPTPAEPTPPEPAAFVPAPVAKPPVETSPSSPPEPDPAPAQEAPPVQIADATPPTPIMPVPAPEPEPQPVVTQTAPPPAPTPTPAPQPAVAPPKEAPRSNAPLPADISTLPRLRASDEVRYGLENMNINGIREPNRNRPYGVAYINMESVYIGEDIPHTRARLIGLSYRGIAIEIIGTGERYFVQHGRS